MLCPNGGVNNQDGSGQCTNCGYKFLFGSANNDPAKMAFFNWSSKAKKSKISRYIFLFIFLLVFILIILSRIHLI